MSTDFDIFGSITIPSKNYSSIIKKLDLKEWLEEVEIEVETEEDSTIIEFCGSFRNYGRYIDKDLLKLSKFKQIKAELIVINTDFMGVDKFELKNGQLLCQTIDHAFKEKAIKETDYGVMYKDLRFTNTELKLIKTIFTIIKAEDHMVQQDYNLMVEKVNLQIDQTKKRPKDEKKEEEIIEDPFEMDENERMR